MKPAKQAPPRTQGPTSRGATCRQQPSALSVRLAVPRSWQKENLTASRNARDTDSESLWITSDDDESCDGSEPVSPAQTPPEPPAVISSPSASPSRQAHIRSSSSHQPVSHRRPHDVKCEQPSSSTQPVRLVDELPPSTNADLGLADSHRDSELEELLGIGKAPHANDPSGEAALSDEGASSAPGTKTHRPRKARARKRGKGLHKKNAARHGFKAVGDAWCLLGGHMQQSLWPHSVYLSISVASCSECWHAVLEVLVNVWFVDHRQ